MLLTMMNCFGVIIVNETNLFVIRKALTGVKHKIWAYYSLHFTQKFVT